MLRALIKSVCFRLFAFHADNNIALPECVTVQNTGYHFLLRKKNIFLRKKKPAFCAVFFRHFIQELFSHLMEILYIRYMPKKISFSDSLHRYFDPAFHQTVKAYIESSDFRNSLGLNNETLALDDLVNWYSTALKTENAAVTFFIRFHVSFCGTRCGSAVVCSTCIWNIPLKEKGLTIGPFQVNADCPKPEWTYGDDLVPIVRKEDYPKMAELFRKKVFGEDEPDSMGIMYSYDVIEKLGLKVEQYNLPDYCVGKIIMASKAFKIKRPDGTVFEKPIEAGTILYDPGKAVMMSQSLPETTLLHESFHWVFHRCAFELGYLYCQTDEGFTCRKDKTATGSAAAEGNKFIEIQTNGVVPYITMNSGELIREVKGLYEDYKSECLTLPQTLEFILNDMRGIHHTTLNTMRRCLVEAGMSRFRGISLYQDDKQLQSYCFKKEALEKDETFCLPAAEMERLFKEDEEIRALILESKFVYTDGHLVLRDPKYVSFEDLITPVLTDYALSHADECFLKFKTKSKEKNSPVRFDYGLDRVPHEMKKIYAAIYDKSLTKQEQLEARKAWNHHIREWLECDRRTFGETFKEIMKFRHKSATCFEEKGLSQDQVYKLYNNKHRPQLDSVFVIGGVLNMPYEVFVWFVEKAGLDFYSEEPKMIKYKEYMDDRMLFSDLSEFNKELIESGFHPLEKKTKAK